MKYFSSLAAGIKSYSARMISVYDQPNPIACSIWHIASIAGLFTSKSELVSYLVDKRNHEIKNYQKTSPNLLKTLQYYFPQL